MTREQMQQFAEGWIANWNRRDIDAVLAHFADEANFTSPKALALTGRATLTGKQAIGDYWRRGLANIRDLEFTLDYVVCDPERRELAVVYTSAVNGQRRRACEFMRFDAAGRQIAGEAMYGADI